MASFTTKSYGTIIYTSPGEDKGSKGRGKRGRKKRPSNYRRLKEEYDISIHTRVMTLSDAYAVREALNIRIKNKVLEVVVVDLDRGYIAKIGADIYMVKSGVDGFDVYLREATRRKSFKKKLKSIQDNLGKQIEKS